MLGFGFGLLRTALAAISTLLGGLGVFFVYASFMRADFAAEALLFLGTATAIVLWTPSEMK